MTENLYNLDYATEEMVTLKTDATNNSIYFVIEPLMAKFTSNNLVIKDGPIKTTGVLEADIWRSQVIVGLHPTTRMSDDGS